MKCLHFFFLLVCLLLIPACARSQSGDTPKGQPLAVVNGQPVYEEDLKPRVAADIQRLRNEEYQIKNRALYSFILEKLWFAEAQKRSLTPEKYLEQEVDNKVPEPTDEEVRATYDAQKQQLGRPFEQVQAQVRQTIKQSRVRQARREFFQKLWEGGGVTVYLEPPKVNVSYDAARLRGNPKAPIIIVEFADFQCPYCRHVQPTLAALLAKYEGQVAVAYRDFPLRDIHPQAQMAAEASHCAEEQGKFWQYHDRLYAESSSLARDLLTTYAQSLSMDMKRFQSCLDTGKYRDTVEQDLQAGQAAGVQGTPAFFINGVFLDGAQPQGEFERVIDAQLAASKKKSAGS